MKLYLIHTRWFGIFIHKIEKSDPPDKLHNHEWNNLSIFLGPVIEHRWGFPPRDVGCWNYIPAAQFHRIHILYPVWRICFHGRVINERRVIDI